MSGWCISSVMDAKLVRRDAFGEVVSISMKDGAPAFVHLARLPGVSRIRSLNGSALGFALYNETSIPCVMNWMTRRVVQLRELPDVTVSIS